MQVHGPSASVDTVTVYLNDHNPEKPFAVLEIGGVVVFVYTPGEADQLVEAAAKVKRLLAGEGEH